MKINMPQGAKYIIEQLNNQGFEAYIVGGCVRDSILGRKPSDWDITTSARPEQIKEIFGRTVDTGIEHGTVTVIVDKYHAGNAHAVDTTASDKTIPDTEVPYTFEVTTYRVDGEYRDHRRPASVEFTASLEEDLKRRDFTINAMAYNDTKGVVDIFGGIQDLESGIIRAVGKASDRFDEDALRILRAERFAAQLGFDIDEDTKKAMSKQAEFLRDISAERIQVELTKLIMSDNPGRLAEAYELGLTRIILPEFDVMMETEQNNPYHMYTVGMHTIKVLENIPSDMVLRYSALLHDIGKPATRTTDEKGIDHFNGHPRKSGEMARTILRRLKLDNNTIDRTCRLVSNHDYGIGGISENGFRRFLSRLGIENFRDLMTLKEADVAGQSKYRLDYRLTLLNRMNSYYEKIVANNYCLTIRELAIDGSYLINNMGMKPGKELGDVLKYLLERVLDEPECNTVEQLTELVKEKLRIK